MWFEGTMAICVQKIKYIDVVWIHLLNEHLLLMRNCNNLNPYESYPLQESLNKMQESVNLLKRAICTMMLPIINTTSPNPLSYAVVTFCTSNDTVFEVSLNTLNQVCVCVFACIHSAWGFVSACVSLLLSGQCDDANVKLLLLFLFYVKHLS